MRGKKLFVLCLIPVVLLAAGCAIVRSAKYSSPPLYFAYTEETQLIKDKSKIVTLIMSNVLTLDGMEYPDDKGTVRVVNYDYNCNIYGIDILPGKHRIIKTYSPQETFASQSGNTITHTTYTYQPVTVDATIDFEAGHVYWVSFSNDGIIVEKDTPGDSTISMHSGEIIDRGLPAYVEKELDGSRKKASF